MYMLLAGWVATGQLTIAWLYDQRPAQIWRHS